MSTTSSLTNEETNPAFELLVKIGVCLRLGTMHHIGNAALKKPMMDMARVVNNFFGENASEVRLQCVKDCFFVNRQIIDTGNDQAESIQMMRRVLRRLAVHEIAFRDQLDYEDMKSLITAFQNRIWNSGESTRQGELHPKVALRILSRAQREKLLKRGDRRSEVIQNYVMLALSVKNASVSFHEQKPISVAKMRRAIQLTYESFDGYENLLLGLTRFTNPDGRSYFHAAGVAALVMLMAKKMKMPRQQVSELALGAMLYDVARDALTDPFQGGKINEQTVGQAVKRVERIPLRSLIRLSMGDPNPTELIRATMAYEATQPCTQQPSLAARIISVASAYQLLSAPIPPRRGLTPDRALGFIRSQPQRYDPEVTELLSLAIGKIPIGTLVQLSTGQRGVVYGLTKPGSAADRPPVRLLTDEGEESDGMVELSGSPEISIEATLDPIAENINVPRVLIGDLSKEEIRDPSDELVTSIAIDDVEVEEEALPNSNPGPAESYDSELTIDSISIEALETTTSEQVEPAESPVPTPKPSLSLTPIDEPHASISDADMNSSLSGDIVIEDVELDPAADDLPLEFIAPLQIDDVGPAEELFPSGNEAEDAELRVEPRTPSIDSIEIPMASFSVPQRLDGESEDIPSLPINALSALEESSDLLPQTAEAAEPSMDLLFEEPMEISSEAAEAGDDQEPTAIALSAEHLVPVQPEANESSAILSLDSPPAPLPPSSAPVQDDGLLIIDEIEVDEPAPRPLIEIPPPDINTSAPLQSHFLEDSNYVPPPPPPTMPAGEGWNELPQLDLIPVPEPPPNPEEAESQPAPENPLLIDLDLD